jgi:hypothetical protein
VLFKGVCRLHTATIAAGAAQAEGDQEEIQSVMLLASHGQQFVKQINSRVALLAGASRPFVFATRAAS